MNTHTQQFIEDAIAGGWKPHPDAEDITAFSGQGIFFDRKGSNVRHDIPNERMFLDPLAWQAVGKTRGWEGFCDIYGTNVEDYDATAIGMYSRVEWYQHRFISLLWNGLTIEEALGKLV